MVNGELALEGFHQGVSGPVEVIARFVTRADVERALGTWPGPAPIVPEPPIAALLTTGAGGSAALAGRNQLPGLQRPARARPSPLDLPASRERYDPHGVA